MHKSRRRVPLLLDSLGELLLPRSCLGCGLDGSSWCPTCLAVELNPVLHRPDPCPPGLPELAAAATYSGSVRTAILAAKERGRRDVDRPLGLLLAVAVGLLGTSTSVQAHGAADALWLIPVPPSPAALRSRGRDHLRDWTRWTVRVLRAEGIPAQVCVALRRRPGGVDSVGLDAAQRVGNLDGALMLRPVVRPPPNARIVLLDDIVTTGATLVAASTLLTAAFGLDRPLIGAAVVAATQRNQPV